MPYVLQERRPALDPVVGRLSQIEFKRGDLVNFLLELAGVGGPYNKFVEIKRLILEADVKTNGDINYILFKYAKYHINPSYNAYKTFMGEIYEAIHSLQDYNNWRFRGFVDEYREAAEWIRIKLLTPYEEQKILENGDV
jgi:hypothetical protein